MAKTDDEDETARKRKTKLPLLLGLLLALAGGGGGFYAMYSGLLSTDVAMVDADGDKAAKHAEDAPSADKSMTFVPIGPLVVSLNGSRGTHLRFEAQLEVKGAYKSEIEHLKPRIVDILNGYLRAVDIADLQDHATLVRLRAQMLRRIQVVTGDGRVSDLLIMEFVMN